MIEIWHNPRCSKSRQALAALESRGLVPRVRRYLEQPPDAAELRSVQAALGLRAIDMMRRKEARFRELGLSPDDPDEVLIAAMARHPELIERPVILAGGRAVIARPPERLAEILDPDPAGGG
ncbi:MAG: arsenate reductase (glutaredoxin) [Roseovarius sp.]